MPKPTARLPLEADLPQVGSPQKLAALRRTLLEWFDRQARDLPWRTNRDPYRIWVSEVMLQQTTVTAVIPFYERFLVRFPNLSALATASETEVLKAWEGLGFYRRARHLHRAAQQLYADHAGEFPPDPEYWSALPGIGRYILGAVLSQAFELRLPIVETNSQRLLSRLFGSRLDPRQGPGKAWVWQVAEQVLPRHRIGDFNQALMELGSLICTPRNPNCTGCPLRRSCAAYRLGLQSEIPPLPDAKIPTAVQEVAVLIRNGQSILLGRLPPDAPRWAGMWELPRDRREDDETDIQAARRIARQRTGVVIQPTGQVHALRHVVTRFRIELHIVEAQAKKQPIQFPATAYPELRWVTLRDIATYPIASTPMRKLIGELAEPAE